MYVAYKDSADADSTTDCLITRRGMSASPPSVARGGGCPVTPTAAQPSSKTPDAATEAIPGTEPQRPNPREAGACQRDIRWGHVGFLLGASGLLTLSRANLPVPHVGTISRRRENGFNHDAMRQSHETIATI